MENCGTPKSVKTAAIASQAILIIWALLLLLSSLFQKNILNELSGGWIYEETEKVFLYSGVFMCIANLAITASNALISKGKRVFMPLVISSVTTGILPIAVLISNLIQTRLTARLMGTEVLAALSLYSNVVNILSYLLYAAAIITIAASAVYAYANNPVNKISERT
ncbi:MAG: hypothetical protein MSJ26_00720 [Oscillospiraceae bacterium]|nr:hypothetical protein [Oscillospiraceae bacterium]